MVEYFKPAGSILDPCSGNGVFLRYLPDNAEWCEIEKGRDFFAWDKPVDWIIGNPPYSIFAKWLRHSFNISNDIVYLVPVIRNFVSTAIMKDIKNFGGIKEMKIYPESAFKKWTISFAIGAIHYQRDYKGDIRLSLYLPSRCSI